MSLSEFSGFALVTIMLIIFHYFDYVIFKTSLGWYYSYKHLRHWNSSLHPLSPQQQPASQNWIRRVSLDKILLSLHLLPWLYPLTSYFQDCNTVIVWWSRRIYSINLGFCETAHLPRPQANINTLLTFRGGVGGQFLRNLNWSSYLVGVHQTISFSIYWLLRS